MDNTNDKELLDQYLRGKLSSVEQLNLEKRLATDISLANQLAELGEVQQGIRLARLASVLEEVQDWEREATIQEGGFEGEVSEMIRLEKHRELLGEIRDFEKEEKEQRIKSHQIGWHWWEMAASIALLLGVGWFTFQPSEPTIHEKLFAEYFEPYPAIGNSRGESHSEFKESAFENYLVEDYEAAIPKFKFLSERGDSLSLFYLGVAQLGKKDSRKATQTFLKFQKEFAFFEDEVNWYLGLAYLMESDHDKAKSQLKKISNHFKSKQKNKLIDEINK